MHRKYEADSSFRFGPGEYHHACGRTHIYIIEQGSSAVICRQTTVTVYLKFNPYSAGIDFSRQNLTSVDVRFWRLMSIENFHETGLPIHGNFFFKFLNHIKSSPSTIRGSVPGLGGFKETKMFLPHPRVKVSIVGSLRDRKVACWASDRQGSNFESCVWRTVSSQSSHHPQDVLLAQFSLYVHKRGLKPDSFHFHPLQVENCDSNSRLVVDGDGNGKLRLERVNTLGRTISYLGGGGGPRKK